MANLFSFPKFQFMCGFNQFSFSQPVGNVVSCMFVYLQNFSDFYGGQRFTISVKFPRCLQLKSFWLTIKIYYMRASPVSDNIEYSNVFGILVVSLCRHVTCAAHLGLFISISTNYINIYIELFVHNLTLKFKFTYINICISFVLCTETTDI